MQPTPFSTWNCKYCYLPNRTSKAVVARETLESLFSQVFYQAGSARALSVVWLARRANGLASCLFTGTRSRWLKNYSHGGLKVVHSLQTNGTRIDDAWCTIFTEAQVNLCISIDGPRPFHDSNRLTGSRPHTLETEQSPASAAAPTWTPVSCKVVTSAAWRRPAKCSRLCRGRHANRYYTSTWKSPRAITSRNTFARPHRSCLLSVLEANSGICNSRTGKITFLREIKSESAGAGHPSREAQ